MNDNSDHYAVRSDRYDDPEFLAGLENFAAEFLDFEDEDMSEEEENRLINDVRERAYKELGPHSHFVQFGETGMLIRSEALNLRFE